MRADKDKKKQKKVSWILLPLKDSSVSGYAARSAANDLPLITKRASHQPFGSVSCLSSMYLLSVMLLSRYLRAFLLCPSPSVACCSDSMVLFPLSAPI